MDHLEAIKQMKARYFCTTLEVLLRRLPNLRLAEEPRITGIILRGPRSLRLAWDAP